MMPGRRFFLLLGAVAAGLLVSLQSHRINPYFLDVTVTIAINVILAVSLNLINGYTGQFSLGHAGFMAIGAYIAASTTMFWAPGLLPAASSPGFVSIAVFPAALLAGGLAAGLAGILVGAPSLRLKGDYLAIVTLGFGEIIRVIFRNLESVGGALGLNGIPACTNLFWTISMAALAIYVVTSIVHSTYGRGFPAVHDDEIAAEAIGINTTRYKITAFVVGAFFAGIAGGLYGHFKLSIDPRGFDFMKSIEIALMVILGGMGNTVGVIIAAILLTLLPELLRPVAEYRMMLYSFLLIVLMLTCPQGLFQPRFFGRLLRPFLGRFAAPAEDPPRPA